MQKSFDKKLNAYKDKVRAGLREFAEEVEASKARGQTSLTTDSFSSHHRVVGKEIGKKDERDEDEEPDDDQEDDYEDEEPDDVEGAHYEEEADSDEEADGQDEEPDQDDELEYNEPAQSNSVNTLRAGAAPSAKVQHTKRIVTDEKQLVVKKLKDASDVRLVIMARKEGLGGMVKLDPKVRNELMSALVDVKVRELEASSVLRVVEQILDKIVESSDENLKAFRSMQVPQNVVRLPFDLADIGKASTDEDFGRFYLEVAKVLGSKSPQFFINEVEVALGLLFEQYKKITKGEEDHQHAHFYTITVGKLPKGMEKLTESYFKRRVLGDMVFAALYDTFHAFRHAKRGLTSWHNNYTKIFKALTSAGEEYDALRMKLLTAGGQAPNGADMRRLKEFETEHKIDKKRQRK